MRFLCSLATTICLATATLASAQTTTVFVSPVTGNPTASGTNLLNALAGITTASATKPYVLKLDPGIYDIGTTILQMKAYVDIEGSGQQSTIVRGPGNNDAGGLTSLVKGTAPAELRNLQVLSQGTAGQASSIPIFLGAAATSVRDVTLISSGATVNWGLRSFNSAFTLTNVTITVSGGSLAYGVSNTGADGSPSVIKRTVITVSGATSNYGIYNDGSVAAVKEVRDVEISVYNGTNNYGFYTNYGAAGFSVEIDNSKIAVTSNNSYGLYFASNPPNLVLLDTNVTAFHSFFVGGSSYGIYSASASSFLNIDQSVVYGVSRSLYVPFATASVGASRLSGSVTIGTPHCAATYNGSYVALGSGCV